MTQSRREQPAIELQEKKLKLQKLAQELKQKDELDFEELRLGLESRWGQPEVLELAYHLLEQLISQHKDFDAIISDDASGRLVALLVRSVFEKQRRRAGMDSINFFGIGTPSRRQAKKLSNVVEMVSKNQDNMRNPLVVTEYVQSGGHSLTLLNIFAQFGIDIKIAALSCDKKKDHYDPPLRDRLISGAFKESTGTYFWRHAVAESGVVKSQHDEQAHPTLVSNRNQQKINLTRAEIEMIADVFDHFIRSASHRQS